MNVEYFRRLLRETREGKNKLRQPPRHKIGRPTLSGLTAGSGPLRVNSQTIKNIEDGRNADPGIMTVARIVEAMGVKLSDFFLQIESVGTQNRKYREENFVYGSVGNDKRGADSIHEGIDGPPIPSPAEIAEAVAFYKDAKRLDQQRTERKTTRSHRKVSGARTPKSHGRKSRA